MSEHAAAAEVEAVLSLGANLGDRAATIRAAIDRIGAARGVRIVQTSSLWRSAAWKPGGAGDAPDYLNAVAIVATTLEPHTLLAETQRIEDALGRVREERYGDRTIDIDIVAVGVLEQHDAVLTLPHPRAHERQFVLRPWLEVRPDATLGALGRIDALAAVAPGEASRWSEGVA